MNVRIISFGYGHGAPPAADLTLDVRKRFRNPADDPAMRERTGLDRGVYDRVMATPRVNATLALATVLVRGLAEVEPHPVVVAIGCAGGRYRSVAMAVDLSRRLSALRVPTEVVHRDVHLPVLLHGAGF
jgi:RNase adaptor protein for sRNA GlmZ degradation